MAFIVFVAQRLGLATSESHILYFLSFLLVCTLAIRPCKALLSEWLRTRSFSSEADERADELITEEAAPEPALLEKIPEAFPESLPKKLNEVFACDEGLSSLLTLCRERSSNSCEAESEPCICKEDSISTSASDQEAVMTFSSYPTEDLWLTSALDDLWRPSSPIQDLAGAEAAVASDANSVLETALISGDDRLADAAISAGMRHCSPSWLSRASGQLSAAGIALTPERSIELMSFYGQKGRADLAVDYWEITAGSCTELEERTSPALYGAVLEACAQCGDFETAVRAVELADWQVPQCRHGQAAFLALARWFARRQDISKALECYDSVRELTGGADLSTHRAVLLACVRSADMARADRLFQDLVASGIAPDGTCFSSMICGHCSAGNVEKAMHYFRRLREHGIVPTGSLFDAILAGCAWMNMPTLMEQVLADMEATGVRPSTSTLAILLRLHGQNRDTDQALAVFNEMPLKHGLKLDGHAYGTLISVCLKNDAFDPAWDAYERLQRADCTAHAHTYEALVAACLRRGFLDQAVRVLADALSLLPPEEAAQRVQAGASASASHPAPRVRLVPKTIEDVLQLIGKRRQAARLGRPLLEQLAAAHVEVSESLIAALLRSAEREEASSQSEEKQRTPMTSELHRRREERQRWRNFPKEECNA